LGERVKISLDELAEHRLEQDIYNREGQLLLKKGNLLTADVIANLKKRGISEVYANTDLAPEEVPEPQPQVPVQVEEVYGKALDFVKNFLQDIKHETKIDVAEIKNTLGALSHHRFSDSDLLVQLRRIKEKDEYLYTHSINVAILSSMIGRWLELDEITVEKLGVAGMLHDVGKVYIPEEILQKPGKLTEYEYAVMKNHSAIGYRLCQNTKALDAQVLNAVLMHHERADGSGYPAQVGLGRIPQEALIVSVADTYDAITSKRVYSEKRSPYVAAEIILRESLAGKMDRRISKVFYDRILRLSIGNIVKLSNNEIGTVVYVNPLKPSAPVVKVKGELIHLEKEESLYIVEVF